MNVHRISQMCGAISVLFLLMLLNPAIADPVKWDTLNKVERHVIKKHKSKWNDYSENKQNGILKKASSTIKGIHRYKKWVKELPKEQQEKLKQKFKEMNPKKFKEYTDKLMKDEK